MQPAFEIFYVLALPDWKPNEATPFQGFAPMLPCFMPLMEQIPRLPPDIVQPTLDPDLRLARQRGGDGAWMWTPVNLSTLLAKRKPQPIAPYIVVMSADEETAKTIAAWRSGLRLHPIHLSYHRVANACNPETFGREQLRHRLIALARRAARMERQLEIDEHLRLLNNWKPEERRPSSLAFHSHNVTRANEMTLIGAGEAPVQTEAGHLMSSPHEDYVQGITQSSEAVMALWKGTEDRLAYLMMPPRPDIFLVAPAMYRGVSKHFERLIDDPVVKTSLRGLDRQRGYTMQLAVSDKEGIDKIAPLLSLRGAEMKLLAAAVGLRAAGTLAATIRLPPAVDRTGGVVGQLARFLRTHENPPRIKAARVFRTVQQALEDAVPAEHRALIARSKTGIKIIADAPIEWLSVNGVPLGIRHDVSRINATPGNLFLDQIRPPLTRHITPDAFRNYLVLSMFEEGDAIAPHLRVATLHTIDGKKERIRGSYASPKSPEEFAAALARFEGPMVIIDSHASHADANGVGGLIIGGKSFDVWSLAGKVRMPPIVVLSACDTHPFDRSHATVANGFLACGAAAVVATALPIRAPQAARFVMRLINRAVHFGAIMNGMGHAVPWTNIVGGVLRMELVTDIIRGFEADGVFDDEIGSALLLETHKDLHPLHSEWFECLRDRVIATGAIDRPTWDNRVPDLIAGSDAIRYLHLGNPEAILLSSPEVAERLDALLKDAETVESVATPA
ncbi:CHAT domain-containing protein [Sphingobium yanoikuyae]|uniref:CHAT domain-containing protein n=1 Tax=Sphingobium yanoikuyae TaxID=13690 RepID=A0A0J9D2I7_SPHYA|nr:CHAT domain-containing protein [Sphingobium yanoikuyae]ATP19920.1 hypothetical protein BV87_16985 [Sphingobium yanoikuyae]KMW30826.1 hypothetical protein BV87_04300 [Sphingobium yanoikuyae]